MEKIQDRWIRVKPEQKHTLPDEETPVIVAYKGAVTGEIISDMAAQFFQGKWYWYDGFPACISNECIVEITHWMPFPELPQEVKKVSSSRRKTRLQDFLEKYPNAQLNQLGIPKTCCEKLGYCAVCMLPFQNCSECWDMPT